MVHTARSNPERRLSASSLQDTPCELKRTTEKMPELRLSPLTIALACALELKPPTMAMAQPGAWVRTSMRGPKSATAPSFLGSGFAVKNKCAPRCRVHGAPSYGNDTAMILLKSPSPLAAPVRDASSSGGEAHCNAFCREHGPLVRR